MNTTQTRRIAGKIRALGCINPNCPNHDVQGKSETWIESMVALAHIPGAPKYRDKNDCPVNPGRLSRTNADAFLSEMWLVVPMCSGCHAEADREGMHHDLMRQSLMSLVTVYLQFVLDEIE